MKGGAYFGDSTQLLYLRARHYASNTGRFLTRDTWKGDYTRPLSLNQWMYGGGNPVNFTDPSGMFSVSQIYQSLGFSNVFDLINAFDTGKQLAGVKGRWAWLKLLMDAREGDLTWYGVAATLPPFLDESNMLNFTSNSGEIRIGGIDLASYANNQLNKRMNWLFPYRNGKPTNYMLNGAQYIDANRPRDLPDFRVAGLDIAPLGVALAGLVPLSICGEGFTGGPAVVIDRYGNIYGELFVGMQLSCLGYISAGEGYVDDAPSSISWTRAEIPNPTEIYNTITGWCGNVQVQVIAGVVATPCFNGAGSVTAFYTPGVGGAVYASFGFETGLKRADLAWDYIDRFPGITKDEVLRQVYTSVCK